MASSFLSEAVCLSQARSYLQEHKIITHFVVLLDATPPSQRPDWTHWRIIPGWLAGKKAPAMAARAEGWCLQVFLAASPSSAARLCHPPGSRASTWLVGCSQHPA